MLLLNIVHNKIFYTATSYLNDLIFTPIAFLINAKNIPKYSFRGFRGVNVSKSWEFALNHCACSPTGLTIFADHFIISILNPECFLFHLESSFRSWDIQDFYIFPPSYPHFPDSKGSGIWNNLWCHALTCINLQM